MRNLNEITLLVVTFGAFEDRAALHVRRHISRRRPPQYIRHADHVVVLNHGPEDDGQPSFDRAEGAAFPLRSSKAAKIGQTLAEAAQYFRLVGEPFAPQHSGEGGHRIAQQGITVNVECGLALT